MSDDFKTVFKLADCGRTLPAASCERLRDSIVYNPAAGIVSQTNMPQPSSDDNHSHKFAALFAVQEMCERQRSFPEMVEDALLATVRSREVPESLRLRAVRELQLRRSKCPDTF